MIGVLPDRAIRELSKDGLVRPFRDGVRVPGQLSWGLQPCGYDVRLAPELLVLQDSVVIADSKRLRGRHYKRVLPRRDGTLLLPPRSFALARSLEEFRIPPDVAGLVLPKGTLSRTGVLLYPATLEPGWQGMITLPILNPLQIPAVLYPHEGVAHVVFVRLAASCERDYGQVEGFYQGHRKITPPRLEYEAVPQKQPPKEVPSEEGEVMF